MSFLFWRARRDTDASHLNCLPTESKAFSTRLRTILLKTCHRQLFLNAKCPLRVRVPFEQQTKKGTYNVCSFFVGAPGGTRTPDLLVRSQALYPTELLAHCLKHDVYYSISILHLSSVLRKIFVYL